MRFSICMFQTMLNQNKEEISKALVQIKNFMEDSRFYNSHQIVENYPKSVSYLAPRFNSTPKAFQEQLRKKQQQSIQDIKTELKTSVSDVEQGIKNTLKDLRANQKKLSAEIEKIPELTAGAMKVKLGLLVTQYQQNESEIQRNEDLLTNHSATPAMYEFNATNPLNDYRIIQLMYHHTEATCRRTGDGVLAYKYLSRFEDFLKQQSGQLNSQQKIFNQILETYMLLNTCVSRINNLNALLKDPATYGDAISFSENILSEYETTINNLKQLIKEMSAVIKDATKENSSYFTQDPNRPDIALKKILENQTKQFEAFKTQLQLLQTLITPKKFSIKDFIKAKFVKA